MIRISFYIARQMVPWILVAQLCSVLIFLVTQVFRVAPVFVGADVSFVEVISLLGLLLVPVVGWALIPAYVIGAFAAAGQMSTQGEWLALDGAGIPRWRVTISPLVIALIMFLLSAWIWIIGAPASQRLLRQSARSVAGRALAGQIEPGRFFKPTDDLVLWADDKGNDGTLHGVYMETSSWNDTAGAAHLVANRAKVSFDPSSAGFSIELNEGNVFFLRSNMENVSLQFEKLQITLSVLDHINEKLVFLPHLMQVSTYELLDKYHPYESGQESRTSREFEFWRRVAQPLGFLGMAMWAVGLAFFRVWRRRAGAIGAALLLFLGYHLFSRIGEVLMQKEVLSAFFGAFFPCVLLMLSFFIVTIVKPGKTRKRPL